MTTDEILAYQAMVAARGPCIVLYMNTEITAHANCPLNSNCTCGSNASHYATVEAVELAYYTNEQAYTRVDWLFILGENVYAHATHPLANAGDLGRAEQEIRTLTSPSFQNAEPSPALAALFSEYGIPTTKQALIERMTAAVEALR